MKKIQIFFKRIALYLLSLPFFKHVYSAQVQEQLKMLNPTMEKEELTKNYYGEKLGLALMIFFFGLIMVVAFFLSQKDLGALQGENQISRADYGAPSEEIVLKVSMKETEELSDSVISYKVSSRHYSQEEICDFVEKFKGECEALILGENKSMDQVSYNLQLASTYEGYPMDFQWESKNRKILEENGTIHNEEMINPETVGLTAIITYGEWEYEYSFSLRVHPREYTFEEKWQQAIHSTIEEADEKQKYDSKLVLPSEIAGRKVTYTEIREDNPIIYLVFLILIPVLLFFGKDNDLKTEVERRKQEMNLVYPEFVSKFLILLGTGMSVRNIFYKLSEDSTLGIYLQRELQILVRDLHNGMLEKEALDKFGKRSGNALYIKFSALIIQNIKKGTGDLLILLKRESQEAFLIRKNHAKQLGEEVGTKLLAPMMIMLAVVMVLIMVPALLSFQF